MSAFAANSKKLAQQIAARAVLQGSKVLEVYDLLHNTESTHTPEGLWVSVEPAGSQSLQALREEGRAGGHYYVVALAGKNIMFWPDLAEALNAVGLCPRIGKGGQIGLRPRPLEVA